MPAARTARPISRAAAAAIRAARLPAGSLLRLPLAPALPLPAGRRAAAPAPLPEAGLRAGLALCRGFSAGSAPPALRRGGARSAVRPPGGGQLHGGGAAPPRLCG